MYINQQATLPINGVPQYVSLRGEQGSLYGRSSYADLVKPFLFSKYYSFPGLIRRQKGGMQPIRRLWTELMQTDLKPCTRFGAPVIFVEGRHNQHVSAALARRYFETIETEKQFFWFEQSCHFPQWSERERFNQLVTRLLPS